MSSDMTDARREAAGWRKVCDVFSVWQHSKFGDARCAEPDVDNFVRRQEAADRRNAELRKPEAPTEWAAGQVWRDGKDRAFVVFGDGAGGFLTMHICENTGLIPRPSAARAMKAIAANDPSYYYTYLGEYTALFGGEA